jgi:predicted transcriptional regulator of viral defense system
MKKTLLATKDGELLEKLIAKYGKVVTASQIQAEARHNWSYQETKNRIQMLAKNGWLIRIKRGLYAISDLSSLGFLSVSPYVIANLLVKESYISFEAALSHRGMFDQFTDQLISVSLKQFKATNLDAIHYRFIKTQKKMYTGWETVEIENMTAQIAFAEKALVDMIHFRKRKYVVDLVIEKLQDYDRDLDTDQLYNYISMASQKTIKIFGLVFDMLGIDSNLLYQLVLGSNSTHRMSPEDKTFNVKWRLYYDDYFEKYRRK